MGKSDRCEDPCPKSYKTTILHKIPWNLRAKVRTLFVSYEKHRARKQKKFWIQLNTGFKWGQILSTTQATCLNLSLQRLSNFNFLSRLQIIQSVLHGSSAEKVSGEWLYQADLIHKCKINARPAIQAFIAYWLCKYESW